MKNLQIKLILFSIIVVLLSFLGSFIINPHQHTTETILVKTIKINKENLQNFEMVPKYFKKLQYRYDKSFDYSSNGTQLMYDLNEKYGATFKMVPIEFNLNIYKIYSVELNNFKKTKKLKKIRYEISQCFGC